MSLGDRLDSHKAKMDLNKENIDRVQYCIDNSGECNDWEDTFLESLLRQLENGVTLSNAQLESLEKIEYLVEWGRAAYWEEFGHARY